MLVKDTCFTLDFSPKNPRCNHLNKNDLMGSNSHRVALFGKVRKCGLIRVNVTLLEEVCYWGRALRYQKPKPGTGTVFLLPADLNVELSGPS